MGLHRTAFDLEKVFVIIFNFVVIGGKSQSSFKIVRSQTKVINFFVPVVIRELRNRTNPIIDGDRGVKSHSVERDMTQLLFETGIWES